MSYGLDNYVNNKVSAPGLDNYVNNKVSAPVLLFFDSFTVKC